MIYLFVSYPVMEVLEAIMKNNIWDVLQEENSALNIRENADEQNCFYQIKTPFQFTLQSCSGIDPDDFVSTLTVSPDKSLYVTENITTHISPAHFHDYYEFLIVLKGSVIQIIEDKEYPYPAGSVCLVNRSISHKEKYTGPAQVIFVGISVDLMTELLNSYAKSYYSEENEIKNTLFYKFLKKDTETPGIKAYLDFLPAYNNNEFDHKLHHLVDTMLRAMFEPAFGTTYIIKGLLSSLASYLSSPTYYHTSEIQIHTNSDFILFSRINHLVREQHGVIKRADLVNSLHYSADYINHIINKYAGVSLFNYCLGFRLKRACEMLKNTDLSVNEICEQLKFASRTQFYSFFKDKYKVTPAVYRKG